MHMEYCIMHGDYLCEKIHTDYNEILNVRNEWRAALKEKDKDPMQIKIACREVTDWCECIEEK